MKSRDVFPVLAPPPGGLAQLRRKMDDARGAPRAWWPRLVPLAAVAVAAAVFILVGRGRSDLLAAARGCDGASEVALGLARPPEEPLTLAGESRDTAVLVHLPTSDPRVALYLVGTVH